MSAEPQSEMQSRWSASVMVPANLPVENCWSCLGNFDHVQVYMPSCLECKTVERESNAVNSVRFVRGKNLNGSEGQFWAKERLLTNDVENHVQRYRLEESSLGFSNYEGCMKISAGKDEGTCIVSWSFEMEPVPGMSAPPNDVSKALTNLFRNCVKQAEENYRQSMS